MDILERAPEHVGSEALNLGYYIKTTVQELLPKLQAHDVEYLHVDPLNLGGTTEFTHCHIRFSPGPVPPPA